MVYRQKLVEFRVEDVDDICVEVFTRGFFRRTRAEYPEFSEIIREINRGAKKISGKETVKVEICGKIK